MLRSSELSKAYRRSSTQRISMANNVNGNAPRQMVLAPQILRYSSDVKSISAASMLLDTSKAYDYSIGDVDRVVAGA